ncbi:hypothetical protein LSPH24S_08774 [Lysinibacillus sphaericus]
MPYVTGLELPQYLRAVSYTKAGTAIKRDRLSWWSFGIGVIGMIKDRGTIKWASMMLPEHFRASQRVQRRVYGTAKRID